MTTLVTRAKKSRVLRPLFAAAASALLLAGCNTAAPSTDTNATSSSSVSSADAMMRRDDDSTDEGTEAMERTEDDDGMMKASSSSSAAAAAMMNGSSSSVAAMVQSHVYKNGTYSADGAYRSPAGGESVTISLTLKDDVVTATSFKGHATAPKSVVMQEKFSAGFQELVVGKSIDELSLDVVNGSSLTGAGFMDAVAKIKAEAKA